MYFLECIQRTPHLIEPINVLHMDNLSPNGVDEFDWAIHFPFVKSIPMDFRFVFFSLGFPQIHSIPRYSISSEFIFTPERVIFFLIFQKKRGKN